jgi:hypothetical protein
MFSLDLRKHAKEFLRYIRNHQYEITPTGDVLFGKASGLVRGVYTHDINGMDERTDYNLIPDEGLIYLLTTGLANGTKLPTWYVAMYSANYTPLANLTAASFPATASEITSNTEGYTESTRPVWTPGAVTTPTIDNLANKVSYTIASASSITIGGLALLSEATKGAVTGKIASATKLTPSRTAYNTDVFSASFRVQLTSS